MKKIILSIITIVSLLSITGTTLAVKPAGNLAAAQKIDWNLSGAVMPLPWGQHDIIGSDTASKLIINQPNGNTEVAITGVMNGLMPNSTYQVYPSNAWSWNVTGSYVIDLVYSGAHYTEYLVLHQTGNTITGTSLALAGNASPWTIESGSVTGNTINFLAHFNASPTLHATFSATIDTDGSMINGSWADVPPGTRSGSWTTTSGLAIDHGYPGLFGGLQMLPFQTDEFGTGSWHINLRNENFTVSGTYHMSIWVNQPGATILVSDNFDVVVD